MPSSCNIYPNNLKRCQSAILSGANFACQEGTINIGDELYAASSIGNYRKNQEDAVILVTHPQNPDFKMLAVSDGMGGMDAGEYASDLVVRRMKEWFENLEPRYYEEPNQLYLFINQELKRISNEIYREKGGTSGATYAGAIVTKKNTVITNVGDSRAYLLRGQDFMQVSKDHSLAQEYFEEGRILYRDDMRFHIKSNVLTQALGSELEVRPYTRYIDNRDYDALILTTDGVTDCLSDLELFVVSASTDKKELAKKLVEESLNNNSHKDINRPEFVNSIQAGKDNTTAAVYAPKKSSQGEDGFSM